MYIYIDIDIKIHRKMEKEIHTDSHTYKQLIFFRLAKYYKQKYAH